MKRKKLKIYFQQIAALYGCKVIFNNNHNGGFANLDGSIEVGIKGPKDTIISVFCHELAHHCNQIDHIYPRYHQSKSKGENWFDPKKLTKSVRYAYRAEQYTDRRGKKICKTWFPGVKFCSFYNGSDYSKGFMLGYLYR
jgi:hypothetical protein